MNPARGGIPPRDKMMTRKVIVMLKDSVLIEKLEIFIVLIQDAMMNEYSDR